MATRTTTVVLPWPSREALLAELRDSHSASGIVEAFEAVGASRPVELSEEQKTDLVDRLSAWSRKIGTQALPDGLFDLLFAAMVDVNENKLYGA